MTSPEGHSGGMEGLAGPGKLIARGYVRVDLSDNTADDLAKLLARLRAVGPIDIPVRLDRHEIDRELSGMQPPALSVKLSRSEVAAQIKGWDPVNLPTKVNRTQLNGEIAKMAPIALPVKIARKQLTDEIAKWKTPVTLPVRFNKTQLTAALADMAQPVTLPVRINKRQLQDQLDELDAVRIRVKFDQDQLEEQLSKAGPVTMPVQIKRTQLQAELNGITPPSMAVKLSRPELQAQLKEWTPLYIPTKVQKTDVEKSIGEWKLPVTIPVRVNRTQLQQQLRDLDPVTINVKFNRAQVQRELKALDPPVVLPVTIDRNKLRRYLETMTPVTIPVRWGSPLNRPGWGDGTPYVGASPSMPATPATTDGGATGTAAATNTATRGGSGSGDTGTGRQSVPSTGPTVTAPQPRMPQAVGSGSDRPDLDAQKTATANLAAAERALLATRAKLIELAHAAALREDIYRRVKDNLLATTEAENRALKEMTASARAYDKARAKSASVAQTYMVAEVRLKEASEEVAKIEAERIAQSPRAQAAMDRTATAQERLANAAGRVRAAETALVEERLKANTTAARLTAREERLANAKRGYEAASRSLATAQRDETAAIDEAVNGVNRLAGAYGRFRGAGKAYLPWDAKLLESTGPQFDEMRNRLFELQQAAKIRPTYEARLVYDEMGRAQVRYFKVSSDQGTFMGEVMSKNMVKSFVTNFRFPAILGPIATGLVAGLSSAAALAVPAVFAKIAVTAQRSIPLVNREFQQLNRDINQALRIETMPLQQNLLNFTRVVGNGFQQLRPQLRDSFEAIGPYIDRAGEGVVRFANNAMPGLTRAVLVAGPVVNGFFDGLEVAGTGVTRFFDRIMVAAPQAGQTFRTFGVVTAEVGDFLGRLGAAVTQVFGGQLWDEVEATFIGLSAVLGDFVEGALPGLGAGLEVAGKMLNVVLDVLTPFAGMLGSWVGMVLGAAIAVRGFSSAIGLLAAGASLLKMAPLTGAVQKLGIQAGNAGTAVATMGAKMGVSASVTERVAAGTGRLVSGLSRVGGALPIVGLAVAALAIGYEELSSKADEAAKTVLSGSQTFQQAVNDERNALEKRNVVLDVLGKSLPVVGQGILGMKEAQDLNTVATANVTAELEKQMAAMAPVERAQAAVTIAQAKYNDAVRDFGPESAAAQLALSNLGRAKADLTAAEQANAAAMRESERAARSLTQALIDQANEMRARVDAGFAYRQAVEALGEANQKTNDILNTAGKNTKEYRDALDEQTLALNSAADAAARRWEAQNAHLSDDEKAAGSAREYAVALQELLPAGQAGIDVLNNMSAELTNADLQMLSAQASATGLKTELVTLADGRQVRIVVDKDGLEDARLSAEALRDFEIVIPVGADPQVATQAISDLRLLVNTTTANIKVGGDTMPAWDAYQSVLTGIAEGKTEFEINGRTLPAQEALDLIIAQIKEANPELVVNGQTLPFEEAMRRIIENAKSTTATMNLDAMTELADGKVRTTIQFADGSIGTITLDANNKPAEVVINGTKYKVDTTTGVMTIDGNPAPGQQDLSGLKLQVDRTTGTLTILGRDGGVQALKNELSKPSFSIHTIDVRTRTTSTGVAPGWTQLPGGGRGSATGSLLKPGRAVGFAQGGIARPVSGLRPLSSSKAEVIKPNTWRIVGDNMRVPELYAPLDGSSRSLDFIKEAAANYFGHDVVPRMTSMSPGAPQAIAAAQQSARAAQPVAVGGGGGVEINGGVTVRLDGTWDFADTAFPRRFVIALEEALRDLGRSRK